MRYNDKDTMRRILMSNLPLAGLKILDHSPSPESSPAAAILGNWGAELLTLPGSLTLDHPDGRRILLLLAQEVDVLMTSAFTLDVSVLHEYNPRLIVLRSALAPAWSAASAVLVALLQRHTSGLGQAITLEGDGDPSFSAFAPSLMQPPAPDETLRRRGYGEEAIAALRREGLL